MMLAQSYPLESLSWQQIYYAYKMLGRMLNDFQSIKNTSIALGLNLGQFETYYGERMAQVNRNIDRLDFEVARRNNLIGVI